ncbi:MAG: hypothetical protein ABSG68_05275 [Thermoguttaceae bacterium]|jgi:uncharacterized PurR-regulated membrane protein YhhQ (DUF165 family)
MSEDCNKKAPAWFVVLTIAVTIVVVTPVGLSVGTLFGILEDFGLNYTVENIRHNPGIFANQFARGIVFTGWAALVAIVVLAVVGCIALIRRHGKPPAKDEWRGPAAPDRLG